MKVALAQINPTVGDISGNVSKILDFGRRAASLGADLVVYPELCITGYPPRDLLLKDSFIKANLAALKQIEAELPEIAAAVGFVDINRAAGRPLFNACAVLQGGKTLAVQHKTLLPTYDVFDEDRYFEPAKHYVTCTVNGVTLGLCICEDIWNHREVTPQPRYQIDPLERIARGSPDVLINLSASPFAAGKQHVRHDLVRHQALRWGVPMVYVNQVCGNDQLIFDGRSIVVDGQGKLIARAAAFAEDLLLVDLTTGQGEIKPSPDDRIVNMYEALVLGTSDYMRKCGFKKAVIGISGGIDSAVTAAIAVKAVGAENVLGVAMPSDYSSASSIKDAQDLADNLGIELKVIPISQPVKCFNDLVMPLAPDSHPGVAEENIQARMRGNILMYLSNKFGYLVLTTGNKSELAVGYCTLYGDMCGGLAVISDLPKMMVYDVARYINEEAGSEIIPRSTIEKEPSAELRPNQRDQDTLPPYVVLDGIIHAYVEQRRSPEDIVALGYDAAVVMDVIRRIDSNEYKREQAAPGLKVTAQAFGVGWRMPIAQGFREQLKG